MSAYIKLKFEAANHLEIFSLLPVDKLSITITQSVFDFIRTSSKELPIKSAPSVITIV
jgi:hypothetical protein